jgi:hypothetical protein
VALVIDIDTGNPKRRAVSTAVREVFGGVEALIYSTAGAREDAKKWRVILPLASPLPGELFQDMQQAVFRALAKHDLVCDPRLDSPSQICYLPNVPPDARDADGVPLFYEQQHLPGVPLELDDHPIAPDAMRVRREREEMEAKLRERKAHQRDERERKIREGTLTDGDRLIDAFNAANPVEDMLRAYGYVRAYAGSLDWQSPHQQSGSCATRVYDNRWHSLSGSDAAEGVGEQAASGGRFGDAYDLYVHYTHHGDHKAAWRELGSRVCATSDYSAGGNDGEPTETLAGMAEEVTAEAQNGVLVFESEPVDFLSTPAAPPIPLDVFPAVLREYAVPLAEAAGHDVGGYLMALLGACGGCIDDGLRVLLRAQSDFFQSARLWVLLIGNSSSAKTPALRAATSPLWEAHGALRKDWEARVAGVKDEEAQAVKVPTLLIEDATTESLRDILRDNPQGVIALYEEFDSWIGSHDAYNGKGKDRGEWLRLYDGGPHSVDRATGPMKSRHVFVPNWGCSILAATTFAGIKRHAKNLPSDGLLQRFMPVVVSPAREWPDAPHRSSQAAREAFARLLCTLRHIRPGVVRLSPAATEVLESRQRALVGVANALEEVSPDIAAHAGKHIGMIGRVALILHCIECGEHAAIELVSGETMRAAERLLTSLLPHARVLFAALDRGDGSTDVARAAAETLLADGLETFTRRDLIQKCRRFRDAAGGAQEACLRFLADAGWIAPDRAGPKRDGQPARFFVHPAVHGRFGAAGAALRQRRAAVREVFGS